MKKLFFIAALGVAGMMSANEVAINKSIDFQASAAVEGGRCSVTIYSIDSQGGYHIERVITRYVESEGACSGMAAGIAGQLATGISPEDVVA